MSTSIVFYFFKAAGWLKDAAQSVGSSCQIYSDLQLLPNKEVGVLSTVRLRYTETQEMAWRPALRDLGQQDGEDGRMCEF